jgi:topoisomerase-4 subunit B
MDDNSDLFSGFEDTSKPPRTDTASRERFPNQRRLRASPPEKSGEYDASAIEILEGLEPVRRRPGMYIGGTDDKALHHLFAEVIDNSMDEAVAGHATFIEVALDADGYLSVTDNGRGIPVDPHPKYKDKSALEVIMTTLHAGGKFDSKVYETSGGLHGVGVSVVNALSDDLEVEVARNRGSIASAFRAAIRSAARGPRRSRRTAAAPGCAFIPMPTFSARARSSSRRGSTRWPARRPICSAAWKSAGPAPGTDRRKGPDAAEGGVPFPGGLKDYLEASLGAEQKVTSNIFAGKSERPGGHGSVEWAITWHGGDGFVNSYCNTIPTPEGGTHEAGLRTVLTRGLKAYGELVGNKRASVITTDDVMISAAAMLSVFVREPEFVGQTKDKLATTRPSASSNRHCATPSTTG